MRLEDLQKQICEKYNSEYIQLDDMEMVAFAMQSLGQQPIYAVRMVLEKRKMYLGLFIVVNILQRLIFIKRYMSLIYINIYLKFYLIWRLNQVFR